MLASTDQHATQVISQFHSIFKFAKTILEFCDCAADFQEIVNQIANPEMRAQDLDETKLSESAKEFTINESNYVSFLPGAYLKQVESLL